MDKHNGFRKLVLLGIAASFAWFFYSRLIDTKGGVDFIDSDKGAYRKGIGAIAGSIYLYHVPVSAYPIPEPDLVRLKGFLNQLITGIADKYRLEPKYFVQTKYVTVGEWPEMLSKHSSNWTLQTGLGMRPDRQLLFGVFTNSPRPSPADLVYHISKDEHFERFFPDRKWLSASDVYLGSGGVIICMASDGEKFLERTRQFYLTRVPSAYQDLDFYLPIIDMDDFGKVSENLTKVWFGFFDVYITETISDPGILIASRHNLDDLLAGFQSVLESENRR